MRRLTAFLFCLVLSAFSGFSAHAVEGGFRSPDEFMLWLENYAGHPEPERISAAFGSIQRTALVRVSPDFVPVLGGFFAATFRQHPERVEDWVAAMERDLNADSAPVFLQTLLLAGSPEAGKVVARQPEPFQNPRVLPLLVSKSFAELTPEEGENAILVWWGAFLANGDAPPIQRIIAALHGFSGDARLSAGRSAALRKAFQLLENFAPKFPRVRVICENALRATNDPQIAEALQKALKIADRNSATMPAP